MAESDINEKMAADESSVQSSVRRLTRQQFIKEVLKKGAVAGTLAAGIYDSEAFHPKAANANNAVAST